MKNVLFATTALVGFAGVAFAQDTGVSLSGSAEMGITYIDIDGVGDEAVFHNDIDVTFTLSGATDNGLTFGATIDLDEAGDGDSVEFENSVFVSGAFGTLSMGDVDGAYDQALDGIHAGGLSDEADQASGTSGFDGLAPEILRYDYAFGPVVLSASLGLEDQMNINDESGNTSLPALSENVYGLGIAYGGDFGSMTLDLGAGVQYTETADPGLFGDGEHTVFGGSATIGFGNFEVIGVVEVFDVPGDATLVADGESYGISGAYMTGPWEFALGYEHSDFGGEADVVQGYVTYDLGGGAEIVSAASWVDAGGVETTRAGFGLGFSF